MSKKWMLVMVASLALIFIALASINAMIKTDVHGSSEYNCSEAAANDPYCACMSAIGDERWCGASRTDSDGGGTTQWSTECIDGTCYGLTDCANGAQLSCTGEFEAHADETGVRCTDSGGGDALADSDYCSRYDH